MRQRPVFEPLRAVGAILAGVDERGRVRRSAVVACALSICLFASQAPAEGRLLVLENLMLIDGTGAAARQVDRLVARDGLIVALESESDGFEIPSHDDVVHLDLDGAWVMPGLIDTHTHTARFPDPYREARRLLAQALRGGVTTVRDMGGDARALAELARAQNAGQFDGPTIRFVAIYGGQSLFADPRIALFGAGYAPGEAPWAQAVTDHALLPSLIARSSGSGISAIKFYGALSRADVLAVGAQAKEQGITLAAHGTVFPAGPADLLEAGVTSLSHAPYLVWAAVDEIPNDYAHRTAGPWADVAPDHPRLIALYDDMARRGVYLDATLFVFRQMHRYAPDVVALWAQEAADWAARATAVAHSRGVRVTTGTDWFEPREPQVLPNTHEELALLVDEAGFTAMEAIVAATSHGAEALGLAQSHGSLTVGRQADVLVLSASPLDDIRNTREIRMVFKDGRRVD